MKTLETERLVLRSWKAEDLDDFYEYAKSLEVGPNAGWKPHACKEESAKILKSFIETDDTWAIELKENHKVIGSVGLHRDIMRAGVNSKMIGYVLSKDYWGRGIMPEAVKEIIRYAFEEEALDLIAAHYFRFNDRSKRVIEKSGFKYEGILRKGRKLFNNEIVDLVLYSMLKEEYREMK